VSDTETIQLTQLAGGPLCVTPQDGEKVFAAIRDALDAGKRVEISFLGVEDLTSGFLNAAIGQLYGVYPADELRERLSVRDASPQDLATLKRSVDRAKEYFRDKARFDGAANAALGEDHE
jgi:hypothetical protein